VFKFLLYKRTLVMTILSATIASAGSVTLYSSLLNRDIMMELDGLAPMLLFGMVSGIIIGVLIYVFLRLVIVWLLRLIDNQNSSEANSKLSESGLSALIPKTLETGTSPESYRKETLLSEIPQQESHPDGVEVAETSLDATKETWGMRAKERQEEQRKFTTWSDSPLINKAYINTLISGNENVGWFEWAVKSYIPRPVEYALNMGCGDGSLERHGTLINAAKHFDAFDVSPGAVEVARKRAKEESYANRVNYQVADLNQHILPKEKYDVVFASQSLHHITNLEHVFSQIKLSLKPDGIFIANEFVGANQFQWSVKQVEAAQSLLDTIPGKYRMGINTGVFKSHILIQSIEIMNYVDPTEAIRSEELMDLFRKYFYIVEINDFGGTLLNLVLEDIIGNFDEEKNEDVKIIKQLCAKEQELIDSGEFDSDFKIIIMRKRK